MEAKNIRSQEVVSYNHSIYIGGMNEGIEEHLEAIDLIRTAPEGDTITLFITSHGGDCDIADNYISAIKDSRATITARAIGCVASSGTSVWLAAPNRTCDERAYFMFHNIQLDMGGDAKILKTRLDFYERHYGPTEEALYRGILTPEEISTIFNAGEVYITGADMLKRLEGKEDGGWSRHMEVGKTEASPIVDEGEVVGVTISLSDGFSKHLDLATLSLKDFDEFSWAEISEISHSVGLPLPSPAISRRIDTLQLIEFFRTSGGKA